MDGGSFVFHDLAPSEDNFRDSVLTGLSGEPKALPCKFFYDTHGAELFEKITRVPEYYLTRTEIAILEARAGEIAAYAGPHARMIELGSGALRKVRILLAALDAPAAYVPVDISREQLRAAGARLAEDFPDLPVVAVCADYTKPFQLPPLPGPPGKRVGFFPGSTIGNFEPEGVVAFLKNCAALLGPGGEIVIGADMKKDPAILDAAYNDKAGTNAAFNLNLLERINRELDGDLAVDRFAHVAFYSEANGRVELYVKSLADQTAHIAGRRFDFRRDEMIHTENSYKYAVPEFRALAARAGFRPVDTWTDRGELFAVYYFRRDGSGIAPLLGT
jgi:L-histidine Nalpha-methyltransferase